MPNQPEVKSPQVQDQLAEKLFHPLSHQTAQLLTGSEDGNKVELRDWNNLTDTQNTTAPPSTLQSHYHLQHRICNVLCAI